MNMQEQAANEEYQYRTQRLTALSAAEREPWRCPKV